MDKIELSGLPQPRIAEYPAQSGPDHKPIYIKESAMSFVILGIFGILLMYYSLISE